MLHSTKGGWPASAFKGGLADARVRCKHTAWNRRRGVYHSCAGSSGTCSTPGKV